MLNEAPLKIPIGRLVTRDEPAVEEEQVEENPAEEELADKDDILEPSRVGFFRIPLGS